MNPRDPSQQPEPSELADRLVALHGEVHAPTRQQWLDLLRSDDGGPVLVLYQVAFRDRATDEEGRDLGMTGKEMFLRAGANILPAVQDAGGQPILGADVRMVAGVPSDQPWDYFGGARYPDVAAVVRLWLDDRFVAAEPDRVAGTLHHRIWFTSPLW